MPPQPDWLLSVELDASRELMPSTLSFEQHVRRGATCAPPLTAFVFSASGVLYDDTAFARWLVQLLNRLGVRTEYPAFRCLLERDGLRPAYVGQADYWDSLRSMLIEIGLSRPQIREVEAAGFARWRHHEEHLRLLPGVANTLDRLAASGRPLSVVVNSHTSPEEVCARFERLGIARFFSAILTSRQTRRVLPDPDLFTTLIQQMGADQGKAAEKSGIAFVSNCATELEAAWLAALTPVAVNATSRNPEVITLQRLADITTLLNFPQSDLLVA